ncbi:MAG: hypothetical protein ABJE47_00105 [bacterium]
MMTDTSASAHLDDGELMVLDDVASGPSTTEREHLASCAQCADRLGVLRQYSRGVSSLIAELDVPDDFRYPSLPVAAPVRAVRPWWTQQQWRRAAAVLFVIGSLAAVPPLRAWTVGWVTRQIASLTGRRATPSVTRPIAPSAPEAAPMDSGATLWFDADGPELAVEVANPQASGTLTFVPSTRPATGVEVLNGAGETPFVREHGVRLVNSKTSSASYRLAIPASVERIRVRIGDRPWQVFGAADVGARRALELR